MKLKKEELWIIVMLTLIFIVGLIFDKSIILSFNDFGNSFIDDFFIWISYAGTWFVVLFIMTSFFLWNERKRKWIFPLWLSLGIAEGIAQILKLIIGRTRPYDLLDIGNLISAIGSSFPSAHAAAVFSSLAVLDKEFNKFKWIWLFIAILVSFSRLYLGVHYLSDIAFGSLIGYLSGMFVVRGLEKIFSKNKK